MNKKKKLCFVVQRYSSDISGGGEALCALYVDLLKKEYDITVLTSCSMDYNTWENVFPAGADFQDGVEVMRFPSAEPRNNEASAELTIKMFSDPYNEFDLCAKWLRSIGPYCPDLPRYLKCSKQDFDLIFFIGYLYCTTTFGLPMVPEKAVLIPTAHDEDALNKCNYFKAQFNAPKAFIYLTEEEKKFVQGKFFNQQITNAVIGAPIEIKNDEVLQYTDVSERFGIEDKYILYIGRVDQTKNCEDLLAFFFEYKKKYGGKLKLVLAGNAYMKIPKREDVLYVGFVNEIEKMALIRQSSVLVLPSKYESLSMVTLEAMSLGVPVLLRAQSTVLKAHAEKSNAGLYFYNQYDFIEGLRFILVNRTIANEMRKNGKKYIYKNYRHDKIKNRLTDFIECL